MHACTVITDIIPLFRDKDERASKERASKDGKPAADDKPSPLQVCIPQYGAGRNRSYNVYRFGYNQFLLPALLPHIQNYWTDRIFVST